MRHPTCRLITPGMAHPVVEGAARIVHRECPELAPPRSPRYRRETLADGICRERQLRLHHAAVDPHQYERYWSAKKRRAWSDRISLRTIDACAAPPALRAHADSTRRADSGCRASNAVRPMGATTMRTIRLRPSLTASSIVCPEPAVCRNSSQDWCQSTKSNSGCEHERPRRFLVRALARPVRKTAESPKR